jgi:tRNA G37 N-methylase TrmD
VDTIKVIDLYTDSKWCRKIGAGPWKEVDLTPYGGRPPIVISMTGAEAVVESMVTKEEAILRGWAEPE